MKRRGALRPRSDKAIERQHLRKRAMREAFGEKPACVGRGIIPACPVWEHDAATIHEPGRRSQGADPTDPEQGIPMCFDGHRWVHDHPAEASKLNTRSGGPFLVLRSA